MKSDKFVVKLKRHLSSYETDQGKQPRKVFIDRCQNSRPTCPQIEEQPQASCATGSDNVSANNYKIIDMHDIQACIRLLTLGTLRDVL